MNDARPKLEVVPGGAADPVPASLPVPADAGRVRRLPRSWPWLLAVAVLVAALAIESQRAEGLAARLGGLESRVAELEGELASADAALEGHRVHLGEVREAVSALDAVLARGAAQR